MEISIGLLLPSSTIRPMGKDFSKAFEKTLNQQLEGTGFSAQIIKESIGRGTVQKIEESLDKFFGFEDVDLISGIASFQSIRHLTEKFEKKKVPFINNTLGEHFIPAKGCGNYLFVNSIHLWQQAWHLGRYSVSNFGKRGLIVGAIYDCGYAFQTAFDLGMTSADSDAEFELKLLPMPTDGAISDIKAAFPAIESSDVDFVFSLFCGEEATIFLEEFHSRGLKDRFPLMGLPFLLEPGKKSLEGLEVYTSGNYFDKESSDPGAQKVFEFCGELSGAAVGEAIIEANGVPNPDQLNKALVEIDSKRTYISDDSPRILAPVPILKNTFNSDNSISGQKVHSESFEINDDKALMDAKEQLVATWLNPYLGI